MPSSCAAAAISLANCSFSLFSAVCKDLSQARAGWWTQPHSPPAAVLKCPAKIKHQHGAKNKQRPGRIWLSLPKLGDLVNLGKAPSRTAELASGGSVTFRPARGRTPANCRETEHLDHWISAAGLFRIPLLDWDLKAEGSLRSKPRWITGCRHSAQALWHAFL